MRNAEYFKKLGLVAIRFEIAKYFFYDKIYVANFVLFLINLFHFALFFFYGLIHQRIYSLKKLLGFCHESVI